MTAWAASRSDGRAAAGGIFLPFALVALLTLWDIYVAGVRPFDLAAVALLALVWILQWRHTIPTQPVHIFTAGLMVVAAYGIVGVAADPDAVKPVIGVLLGAGAALMIVSADWPGETIARGLRWLILGHAAALYLQTVVYYSTGQVLNFYSGLGLEPRLTGLLFRPGGLFLEPATFSLTMFGMVTLYRLVGAVSPRLEALALLAMTLTISLWGIAAVFLYLLLFRPKVAFIVGSAAFLLGGLLLSLIEAGSVALDWMTGRLENLGSDGSANSRYGGLFGGHDVWTVPTWFGHGISNDYHATGSSGISFLIHAMGLVGLLAFVAFWLLSAPSERRTRGGVALAFMLTAAPIWTAVWWWAWIALAASARQSTFDADIGTGGPLAQTK